MRLFVAIPLPDEVKEKLQELQRPTAGIRWTPRHQMHITLRFFGETTPGKFEIIRESLKNIQTIPFSLTVRDLGAFPTKKSPRIIWVGVDKVKPLMQLQSIVEEVSVKNGFKSEKREFIPHITLGKVKSASPEGVQKWMDCHKNWGKRAMWLDRFVLYESRPKAGGVVHETIEEYLI